MIDSVAREAAADALMRFRDGIITNFGFEESWPRYDRRDRGIHAIDTMVWRYYDDLREHKLIGEYGLLEEGRSLLEPSSARQVISGTVTATLLEQKRCELR